MSKIVQIEPLTHLIELSINTNNLDSVHQNQNFQTGKKENELANRKQESNVNEYLVGIHGERERDFGGRGEEECVGVW